MQSKQNQRRRFSAKAVQARDDSLADGTALVEIEKDPDRDSRFLLRGRRALDIIATREAKASACLINTHLTCFKRQMHECTKNEQHRRMQNREQETRATRESQLTASEHSKRLHAVYHHLRNSERSSTTFYQREAEVAFVSEKIEEAEMIRLERLEGLRKKTSVILKNALKKRDKGKSKKQTLKEEINRSPQRSTRSTSEIIPKISNKTSVLGDKETHAGTDAGTRTKIDQNTSDTHDLEKIRRPITSSNLELQTYPRLAPENPRSTLTLESLRTLARHYGVSPTKSTSTSTYGTAIGRREANQSERRALVYALADRDYQTHGSSLKARLAERGIHLHGSKNQLLWRVALDDAGKLVGGSDFYEENVNPFRRNKRTFGSLTPARSDKEEESASKVAKKN